jgi:hypothetical protein
MSLVGEALPGGASWKRCQGTPAYQKASHTEPSGAVHHTSMLSGTRDTASIPPLVEALPGGASSKRCQPGGGGGGVFPEDLSVSSASAAVGVPKSSVTNTAGWP